MPPGTDLAAALAHHNAGRLGEAEREYRSILLAQPRHSDALHFLGLLTHQTGDDAAAAELIRQAIAIRPREATYHSNLGVVLLRMRRVRDAAAALRTAIRLRPSDFGAQSNLGVALSAIGDHDGAIKAAGAALLLRPGDPATLCNRGQFLERAGQYERALAAFDAAINADADNYMAHLARGALLLRMGRTADALDALDTAIPLRPGDLRARQARIVAMNYLPGATMSTIGDMSRRLAPTPPSVPARPFTNLDMSPDRPLRVGYVSGDFRDHPVSYFLKNVIAAGDKTEAITICYDNGLIEDDMTASLKAEADHWRPVAGLDDDQATRLIRSDRIDILIDLAGHTDGNRLGLFTRRAAPVQAAWLGYFGSTGVTAMDYIIADRHVLPASDEPAFIERVVRLPDSYLCFTPPAEAGPVADLPSGLDRPITFGCFNNRAKLNPDVLALWALVLNTVSGSRLLLKSSQYADRAIRHEVARSLIAAGVEPDRILFEPASPIAVMFEAYGRVDIALDPFPFSGGATTAQALWMGVPVISLAGQVWPGRQGLSLLTAAGFPEWAVTDKDSYVALAKCLAEDRRALIALRREMRSAVAGSALCRADQFAMHLRRAYRAMWHAYLGRDQKIGPRLEPIPAPVQSNRGAV